MPMKTSLVIAFAILINMVQAQTLQQAITKTENERYEAAATDFKSLIAQEANKGEYYFYYGENFFNKGDLDSANMLYQKGAELNPTNPLNYVGLGKVLLMQGKEADAKTQFFKAASLGANKNTEVMRKTAEAYLASDTYKNPDEAINLANAALKLEPKNPENYILLGDAQLEKNPTDGSAPIKNYQKATELNPKSAKGILREGKLYQRGRNYQLALEKYKAAEAIDNTFAPAYREIAELYFLAGQNAKSIENWKKYLELNNSNYARYRYMSALYKNKQYAEAVVEAENLNKLGYSNLYIQRLAGYSYAEMGDKTDKDAYNKGLVAITKFFEMAGPGFKYLPSDYKYKGILLSKTGKDSLGVVEIEKAIAIDREANCELWGEVARIWMKGKNYSKSITAFEKKQGCAKGLSGQDNSDLGRAYYFSGGAILREASVLKDAKAKVAKEAEAVPFLIKADSSFSKVTQTAPNFASGYFWRARVNTQLDPTNEKGLAKPYFEKGLSLVKPEEKTGAYKTNVIESYEYLGGYYTQIAKDNEKAKEFWTLLKEVDPNNAKANAFLNPKK